VAKIGFSTGSLAYADFNSALKKLYNTTINAIELSALRENELLPLLNSLDDINLEQFEYISFHAPSKLVDMTEIELVKNLDLVADREFPIVLHPNVINDFKLWEHFGDLLCIENMDKRKPIGRTVDELDKIFEKLPNASFCFDIGHSRQVDTTMMESINILNKFYSKIKQIHLSEVDSFNKHLPISDTSFYSFVTIFSEINKEIPVILETPVSDLENEINKVLELINKERVNYLYEKMVYEFQNI
jgi:hypothetical protein